MSAFFKKFKQTEDDANRALQSIKDTAETVGLVKHAVYFNTQAEEHRKAARWWPGASLLASIMLVLTRMFIYFTRACQQQCHIINIRDYVPL